MNATIKLNKIHEVAPILANWVAGERNAGRTDEAIVSQLQRVTEIVDAEKQVVVADRSAVNVTLHFKHLPDDMRDAAKIALLEKGVRYEKLTVFGAESGLQGGHTKVHVILEGVDIHADI